MVLKILYLYKPFSLIVPVVLRNKEIKGIIVESLQIWHDKYLYILIGTPFKNLF